MAVSFIIISNFPSPSSLSPPPTSSLLRLSSSHNLTSHGSCIRRWGSRSSRGLSLKIRPPRAGPPGTATYVFAFVFPLSLILATVFTSIQISDKLDRQFLEEIAVNRAILEAAEDDDDDDDDEAAISVDEESTRPRSRNRPKREAEV